MTTSLQTQTYRILSKVVLNQTLHLKSPTRDDVMPSVTNYIESCLTFKVPLRRKFVGLFRPNSVAEYRVVSIFTQKTEQETVHPNIF